MRALSHPIRRRLIAACVHAPQSAGDLTDVVALAPASVSEHLRVLRAAGILRLERDGRFRYFRTDTKLLRAASTFVRDLAD